ALGQLVDGAGQPLLARLQRLGGRVLACHLDLEGVELGGERVLHALDPLVERAQVGAALLPDSERETEDADEHARDGAELIPRESFHGVCLVGAWFRGNRAASVVFPLPCRESPIAYGAARAVCSLPLKAGGLGWGSLWASNTCVIARLTRIEDACQRAGQSNA